MRDTLAHLRVPYSTFIAFLRPFCASRAQNASLAISLGLEDTYFADKRSCESLSVAEKLLSVLKSATFKQVRLRSVSLQILCSLSPTTELTNFQTQVKEKISVLLKENKHDELLDAVVALTLPALAIPWSSILTRNELSYIMGLLVAQQSKLLTKGASYKFLKYSSYASKNKYRAAHRYKTLIRQCCANILKLDGHLYAKRPETVFELTSKDYENIISLELRNGKLDLASKWFRQMEKQYPSGEHYSKMTQELWLLKFKVFGGAQSSLWVVDNNGLNDVNYSVRESFLKAETLWMDLFEEFSKYHALLLGSSSIIFHNELACVLLSSIAYSKNVPQAQKMIQQFWGILPSGEMAPRFLKPAKDDLLHADIDVLRTVAVALIFNDEFQLALAYINGFQINYDIDLLDQKLFWDDIFRWSDSKTRFKEYRALQIYLKETKCTAVVAPTNEGDFQTALKNAQKSPHFDYEGYLNFVSRLSAQRLTLFTELWKCYRECAAGFSTRPYETYLTLIKEAPSEQLCYELLSALAGQWHKYHVASDSFNKTASSDITQRIEHQYAKTMEVLLDVKGEAGGGASLMAIVNEWSLDSQMRKTMGDWLKDRESHYAAVVRRRELKQLKEQEEARQENKDQLLDIF